MDKPTLKDKACKCGRNIIQAVFFKSTHYITDSIFGENHTATHRTITGCAVMLVGVAVAHSGEIIAFGAVKILADVAGYGLHGIGLVPIIKQFENTNH